MRSSVCALLILFFGLAPALPTAAAAGAPGTTTLDSLQESYAPVVFDHEKHTQIAGACATCHHEHGAGLTCKQCHAIAPSTFRKSVVHSFMPCKNCHGVFDPDNPSMPGLKTAYHRACFTCHRGMGNIGTDPRGCAELCHAKEPRKQRAMR